MPLKDGLMASEEIIQIERQENKEKECKIVALTSFTD